MYERTWLKTECKRLPDKLDRELERRLGMKDKELERRLSRELEQPTDPFNTQIGGSHYKDFPIQPAEFITKNKLTWLEGCVVKRICRKKNRLEDLQKAKHEIDLIIKLEGLL